MGAKYLGGHMPTSGGLPTGIERGQAIGATAIQVFTTSPRQWKARPLTDEVLTKWKALRETSGITKFVSHDSYLVDLSSAHEEGRQRSIDFLVGELNRASLLGIPYVVSHMGSGKDEVEGLRLIAENAKIVLDQTPDDVMLIMETTAGQGSDLGYKFEHWAAVMDVLKRPARLGICFDTCHVFAAGYDIRTQDTYEATLTRFDELIGIERIKCIHCNDSKKAFGSRVDRHEHIGQGMIGEEAFRLLVNDPRFTETMIVLETPDAENMHGQNLAKLRSLIHPA